MSGRSPVLCFGGTLLCVWRVFLHGFARKRRRSRRKPRVSSRFRKGTLRFCMFFSLFLHIKISRGLPPCAAAIWYHANAVNRGSTCGKIVSLLIGKNCEKTSKNVESPGENARKHDVFENSGFVPVQNSAKTRKEHTAAFRPGAQSVRSTVIASMKSWRVMG